MAIVNRKREEVHQQMISSRPNLYYVHFNLYKKDIIKSDCQQTDGSLNIYCKILSFVKKECVLEKRGDVQDQSYKCRDEFFTQFEEMFDAMKFSDMTFNICGREFPAHKVILASRSKVFAAMFEHPTKEKLSNQVNDEDIDPDVFYELLRFIYTGQVPSDKMETMAGELLAAADKYLLDQLKTACENHLLRHISPENCVELLLHADFDHPEDHLKEMVKFFRRFSSEVMATDKWKKTKQENPRLVCDILESVLSSDNKQWQFLDFSQ